MKLKNLLRNRKFVITVASVVAILGVTIGSTYALLTSTTDNLINKFSVGSVDTELKETISGLNKKPYVTNIGKSDCLVRMRVTISPSDVGIGLDLPGSDWVKDGEFYYYQGVLAPTKETSPLFTEVTLPSEWYAEGEIMESKFVPFDIGLYQEAIQTTAYNEKGEKISAYTVAEDGNKIYNAEMAAKIWAIYDATQ